MAMTTSSSMRVKPVDDRGWFGLRSIVGPSTRRQEDCCLRPCSRCNDEPLYKIHDWLTRCQRLVFRIVHPWRPRRPPCRSGQAPDKALLGCVTEQGLGLPLVKPVDRAQNKGKA